jgi:Tol biopolymer transport system component
MICSLRFQTNNADIWLTDLSRGSIVRFTFGPTFNSSPVWSRDGSRLIFRTTRRGVIEFYQKSAGGSGNEEAVLTVETARAAGMQWVNLVPTDWSPDGRHVILTVPEIASGFDLWLLPVPTSTSGTAKPVRFLGTAADEIHGNFSPAGRFVAYSSNESGGFEVYIQTFPRSDRKWSVSTNGGHEPRWRADGREIYYLSADRKLMAVSVGAGPTFAVPKPLFQTRVPAGVEAFRTHYVPTRDGQRFLINTQTGDPSPNPITVVLNWTAALNR